jgi:phenylalanyl-tRNA synthetase beta chain
MKFSENWLREWVPLEVGREVLCRTLTMAGLEVESITPLGEQLAGVVVGEILEAAPHPNAEKLRVCKVSIGAATPLTIVCGAPNARAGLKAPLAMIGATLPGPIAIKAASLRGVESSGMLCSAKELGLSADASGLLELPGTAHTGAPLAEALGLLDAVIELSLTPNRSDCLGMRGLAREVAAEFGVAVRAPTLAPVAASSATRVAVELAAPADCPRYLARVVEGFRAAAATPHWIVERLQRAELRPSTLVVDITNYVMLELGQPLHAFDADRIGGGIVVRRARAGERLTLLDDREVELDHEFLLIADHERALALAGVMGGAGSRVTTATSRVLFEAAHFAPAVISGRARRLAMHTDASHRFERGVDPELPALAIERATELLVAIAGGRAGPVVRAESTAHLPQRKPIRLRRARLARLLGIHIDDAEVARILQRLELAVRTDADGWVATPPSHRFDLEIEEDLIEEVARIHGYDRIPTRLPHGELPPARATEHEIAYADLRAALAARDCFEAIHLALVDPNLIRDWGLEAAAVPLSNPLSGEISVLRTALLPNLVRTLQANRRRQNDRVRLFEIGRVFRRTADARPDEFDRIALAVSGPAAAEQWGERSRAVDFFDLKGDLEALLALRGKGEPIEIEAGGPSWLHPGQAARLRLCNVDLGCFGQLHPALAARLDLRDPVYVAELDLAAIVRRRPPNAGELSRFPSVRRDLALIIDQNLPFATLASTIRDAAPGILRDLVLFDEYRGPSLGTSQRSLAIGLILQDDSRTLTDADADQTVAAVVTAVERQHGGRLRV